MLEPEARARRRQSQCQVFVIRYIDAQVERLINNTDSIAVNQNERELVVQVLLYV